MQRITTILFFLFLSCTHQVNACSMYKVSLDGKTMVGNNEDAWRTTPQIWFEASTNNSYGCCFVGSREIGKNKFAAQSGMNEHGMTFSRLTSYHPAQISKGKSLKLIENPDLFLMEVMRSCSNVDEVEAMLAQYDRTCFLEDVFVYVEPSGKYLIVEPYKLIPGTDPSYVQANYCPSITKETDRRKLERYRKGRDLLNSKLDTTWEFCTHVSNEMHVSRDKIGDGTLLTTIWNTKDLQLKLHFYHDYGTSVSFDLMEELSKGNHQLEIKNLFRENEEFAQLSNYITPFNTPLLRVILALVGLLFACSSVYFLIAAFRTGRKKQTRLIQIFFSLLLILGFCFAVVLTTTIGIYYFPSPYASQTSTFESIAAYIPYLLLPMTIVLVIWFLSKRKTSSWSVFSKGLIALNSLALAGMIVGFFYWELLY